MNEKQYKAYAREMGYEVKGIHYKALGVDFKSAICGTWTRIAPKQKVGRGARARLAKRMASQ